MMRLTVEIDDRLYQCLAKAGTDTDHAVNTAIAFWANFRYVAAHIDTLEKQIDELKVLSTRNQLIQSEQLQRALDIQAGLNEELANWKQIAIAAQEKAEMLEKRSPQLPPIDR